MEQQISSDIEYWRFYARNSSAGEKYDIGTIPKKGFETSFIARGYMDWVSVEALNANMESLGVTPDLRTKLSEYWDATAPLPQPDNPKLFTTENGALSVRYEKGKLMSLFLAASCSVPLLYCLSLPEISHSPIHYIFPGSAQLGRSWYNRT